MTRTELNQLIKATQDIFYFVKFVFVVHPILGKVQFDLYPFQIRALYEFLSHRFNIVLKSRQMGLSELICLYVLWLASFHPHKNIQIISLKDRVAKKLMRRIKFMYKNLPPILQTPIINGRKGEYGTGSEMIFNNGSTITSIPTTEDAGRSEAVSLLIMDEAAIMQYAEVIWAAAFPTLSTGGSAIINSTPYGVGGFFYSTWSDGLYGINGFNNLRVPWDMHPERDIAWYKTMRNTLGAKRTAQEIDCDFLASGDTVFDLADIKDIEDSLLDYPIIEKRLNGNLLIFKKPKRGVKYYMGIDVSTGRAKDYSAFSIMDQFGDEVAAFKGRVPVNRLRDVCLKTGAEYNYALMAPEGNDVGEALVAGIQERGYPNLYYTTQLVREKGQNKPATKKVPGWYTTSKNRPIIINGLEEDIREETVSIKNPFFVNESYTFIYNAANRPEAMSKGDYIGDGSETYTDDSIMAECITNFIRKGKQAPAIPIKPQ